MSSTLHTTASPWMSSEDGDSVGINIPRAVPKRTKKSPIVAGDAVTSNESLDGLDPSLEISPHVKGDGTFKRTVRVQATTREEWLQKSVALFGDYVFDPANYPIPRVEVTVGFPSKKGAARILRCIGQCWARRASANGLNQIFLSPTLDSPQVFLATLAHELVHAVDDCQSGHRGAFAKISKAIGLTDGKPSNAKPGPELTAQISRICSELGSFPHATLSLSTGTAKPQGTRLLKISCPSCGYTCRTTAKWVAVGLPICHCKSGMQLEQ
jgi:hypothetical protein